MQVSSPKNGQDGLTKNYLILLGKYIRVIISISAAVTVLTYLCLFISPNKYEASSRLLPPQQNMTLSAQLLEGLGGMNPVAATPSAGRLENVASLLGMKSTGAMYVSIMTGKTIFDRIIARFNLLGVWKLQYLVDARKRLARMVKISEGRHDGLISIEATDDNPERAAAIANAFSEELDKLLQQLAVQEARDRLSFLEKERNQTCDNLAKAEESLKTFSEKNSVLQIDVQTRGTIEYIAKLRAEVDAKEIQMQVLRQQAGPLSFDLKHLETELAGLKERMHLAELQLDQSCIGDVCLATSRVPALGLQYLRLYRELKFQEALYQMFCKLSEIARVDEVRNNYRIKVVDCATPPERRSNKRLVPSLLTGACTFFCYR